MNLTLEEIASLELRGTDPGLRTAASARSRSFGKSPWPSGPISSRSDSASHRAEADVRLAKANAFSDVYVLWQPYTFQDNSPYGLKSQYSWALGVTVPLPIYNRNQGGISRAKINVTQSQIQLCRRGTAAPDRRREGRPGIRGLAPAGGGAARPRSSPTPSKCVTPPYDSVQGGETEPPQLPPGPARLQRRRQAIPRHGGPAPAEHALAQHGRGRRIMP